MVVKSTWNKEEKKIIGAYLRHCAEQLEDTHAKYYNRILKEANQRLKALPKKQKPQNYTGTAERNTILREDITRVFNGNSGNADIISLIAEAVIGDSCRTEEQRNTLLEMANKHAMHMKADTDLYSQITDTVSPLDRLRLKREFRFYLQSEVEKSKDKTKIVKSVAEKFNRSTDAVMGIFENPSWDDTEQRIAITLFKELNSEVFNQPKIPSAQLQEIVTKTQSTMEIFMDKRRAKRARLYPDDDNQHPTPAFRR